MLVRLPTDKAGAVASPVKRVHPATHLGADHNVLARHAPDCCPATMFRQAMPIERGSVEQIDAQFERPPHRGDCRGVVQLSIEITKWRGAKAQRRNLNSRPSQQTSGQC